MINKVLIIEDDTALRNSIVQTLELEELDAIPTGSFVQARRSIRSNFAGVILSDIRMPDQDGFDVLQYAHSRDPDLPVILVTGHSDVPTAIRSVREGAYDYLEKPFETEMLISTLHRALKHRSLVLHNRDMSRQLDRSDVAAQNFPGRGFASQTLRHDLREAASNTQTVHLYGDEGSGKRTAAFVIHALCNDDRVFETLNCETATVQQLGQIDPDQPITLSVKNEHEMPSELADFLAAFIKDAPDLRLITTSIVKDPILAPRSAHTDIIDIRVPSIRDRHEDMQEIFVACLRQTARATGMDMPMISPDISALFLDQSPPRNFFQLRQIVGEVLSDGQTTRATTLPEKLDQYEKSVIEDAMKSAKGRVADAAQTLGIPRNTLYDRMAKLELKAKDFRCLLDEN